MGKHHNSVREPASRFLPNQASDRRTFIVFSIEGAGVTA
jgi:hypothetical protein